MIDAVNAEQPGIAVGSSIDVGRLLVELRLIYRMPLADQPLLLLRQVWVRIVVGDCSPNGEIRFQPILDPRAPDVDAGVEQRCAWISNARSRVVVHNGADVNVLLFRQSQVELVQCPQVLAAGHGVYPMMMSPSGSTSEWSPGVSTVCASIAFARHRPVVGDAFGLAIPTRAK